ncbi:MAG: efflux RND transporter permease subunit, partial [Alphaproteobacteria bacterium]|nr:efflux RND transporter permease subunit [Alphaproteobacteria bacterium]
MNFSAPFIRRPIGTILLTLGIVMGGIVAFTKLPVAPLPSVDFPVIFVEANLPGASPTTMASSVAVPLERHLQVIAGVNEVTSQSSLGSTRVILQFDLNRDIDGAARDVQAAINAARADLPSTLKQNPTYQKANPNQAPILILTLTSPTRTPAQIYDTVSNVVLQKLAQIDGVGEVELGGATLPATRIDLNPQALAKYGISLEDARIAVASTNANRPKGVVETRFQAYQIYTNRAATSADDFKNIIIAYRNGAAVRLSDIAHVYDGPEDVRNMGLFSNGATGKTSTSVAVLIRRQPSANIIATVDAIKAQLPALRSVIPGDIHLDIMTDRTLTIRASVHDVEISLLFATVLVVLVVSVFLRSLGATAVPAIAVIVSLAGTLGVMELLGFSINNFSLMGLTVATGFVVDDAIVVLENIVRHVEQGESPFQAALKGAREVGFTIITISVSLVAVFIPILFMGGVVGRLMAEFAVTITASVLISLVIALTTTPMVASLMLRQRRAGIANAPSRLAQLLEHGFALLLRSYTRSLDWALVNRGAMLVVLLGCVVLTGAILAKVPKGLIPEQDVGGMMGGLRVDQANSFATTSAKMRQIVAIIRRDPAVDNIAAFSGQRNFMFVTLKPKTQRDPVRLVIARLRKPLSRVTGVSAFLNPVQDLMIGGRSGNALYQYTLEGSDSDALATASHRLAAA